MSLARQIKPKGEGTPEAISTGEYRSIDLQAIRLDQSAQPRESLNTERTAEYAEAMKAGDKFPSLVVFFDGEVNWLADGFHRHYAAQQAGIKALSCRVLPGGLRDAILWSVGANAKHGLARSDEDKKRAVMRLLDDAEWSTWTDRDIAKRCHVSHPFVAKIRKAHAGDTGNVSSMERTYVHPKTGKPTTMKTAGINASRTQFQAKASEDNGSITGGAGAVTGEASIAFAPKDAKPIGPATDKPKKDGGAGDDAAKADLAEARAEYEAKLGRKPFNGWDAKTLREKIAAA
ncbi:ParB/RepB/Spo0J family partition protein [Mesorhizobium sp. CN5-321]|uniref:ParB/RepB/Spo0J family partition protein n=1 Tax=Mesorhizobium hunchu TaxID=3157708 RepID=UPI0032B74DEE